MQNERNTFYNDITIAAAHTHRRLWFIGFNLTSLRMNDVIFELIANRAGPRFYVLRDCDKSSRARKTKRCARRQYITNSGRTGIIEYNFCIITIL